MDDSIYDSPWTNGMFDQSFWQQMLNWVNDYFVNIGVTPDGPMTAGEQAQVEA